MIKTSIYKIAQAIGAQYSGPEAFVEYISTDSRDIAEGCLFVALEGERVDGHKFTAQVLEAGAGFAVAHHPVEGLSAEHQDRVLYVQNTFDVLLNIAAMYRAQFDIKTVGITGSVGKTTTKEFIALVMGTRYKTLKSEGNNNNEIGLPKTVFKLDHSYEAAVFEMGMDHLGDIAKLTEAVHPDIAVITNIGVSHIEIMGSREAILSGKLEIVRGMKKGSPLIICADNDLLNTLQLDEVRIVRFGIEGKDCDVKAENILLSQNGSEFDIRYDGNIYHAVTPAVGRHNIYNALAAFAVGLELGIEPNAAVGALADYTPSGMRQRIREHDGMTIVEDCYNASPDSMLAALDTMAEFECRGRKICVFADMLELGDIAQSAHLKVGELAGDRADMLFAYGTNARYYCEGALKKGIKCVYWFEDREKLAESLLSQIEDGDLVWLKGSRGMKLEDVLEAIYSRK